MLAYSSWKFYFFKFCALLLLMNLNLLGCRDSGHEIQSEVFGSANSCTTPTFTCTYIPCTVDDEIGFRACNETKKEKFSLGWTDLQTCEVDCKMANPEGEVSCQEDLCTSNNSCSHNINERIERDGYCNIVTQTCKNGILLEDKKFTPCTLNEEEEEEENPPPPPSQEEEEEEEEEENRPPPEEEEGNPPLPPPPPAPARTEGPCLNNPECDFTSHAILNFPALKKTFEIVVANEKFYIWSVAPQALDNGANFLEESSTSSQYFVEELGMGHGLPLCNLANDSALAEKHKKTGLDRFSEKICNVAWHKPKLTNLAYKVKDAMVIESYNIMGEDINRSELNRKARLNMLGFTYNENNSALFPGKLRINPTRLDDVILWDVPRYQPVCRKAVTNHIRAGRSGLADYASISITDDLIRKYCSFESRAIFYEQSKTDAAKFDEIDTITIHGQYFNIRVTSQTTFEGWPNASGLEPGILTEVPRYFSNGSDSSTKPCLSEGSTPQGWCNFTTRTIYQHENKSTYKDNVEIITNSKTLFFLPKGQSTYTKKSLKDVPRYKAALVP